MPREHATLRCELSQRFFFEAAHTLQRSIDAEGSLRIHGHTYLAEVTVAGAPDPISGMVVDLGHLRAQIAKLRAQLDHQFLDDLADLGPATLENLCCFIKKHLGRTVPRLCAVSVAREASGDKCVLRWS